MLAYGRVEVPDRGADKIVAGRKPKYGFSFTADKNSLLVDEEQMAVVRRIFEMVGPEGKTINATQLALSREGVPTASVALTWSAQAVRAYLLDDAYKPHDHQEIGELVSANVWRSLDPRRLYGVWWFNRRKYAKDRRTGKKIYEWRPRSVWIAVPDAGVPREWVELARRNIRGNRKVSSLGKLFWELSGGSHAVTSAATP